MVRLSPACALTCAFYQWRRGDELETPGYSGALCKDTRSTFNTHFVGSLFSFCTRASHPLVYFVAESRQFFLSLLPASIHLRKLRSVLHIKSPSVCHTLFLDCPVIVSGVLGDLILGLAHLSCVTRLKKAFSLIWTLISILYCNTRAEIGYAK